ncbi:MAG: protein kinase [Phycisphaerae bacterium]|jgi:serine/threonine protein kinase
MGETTRFRIRELFAAASELPVADRNGFLDRACGGDAVLRGQVLSLLSALERAGDFLAGAPFETQNASQPNLELNDTPPASERTIGPYRLLERVGEGGFGEVWMARQESPVRRRVALKILKLGMDSRRVIARFEQERQALALMDHPNIARVYDAGTSSSGRPYFVMELVRGAPVTQFCDQHKLTIEQRLRLFRDVCDAVQHAHSKGVIHRDLKPSNVLVALSDSGGGTPLPKVIDFGIAKAISEPLTERTLFTELHAMIGTPAYMSPEQAELNAVDIDTRSDIYSLGVLLYELLTGSTPLEAPRIRSAGLAEIQRLIREEPAVRPSLRIATLQREASRGSSEKATSLDSLAAARRAAPEMLQRRLSGELDWIVLKAIEKDRNRRYATASALARDVQRYLDREPVEAGPVSMWYRTRKFAQRHRAAVTGAVAVAGVLILASVALLVLMLHALRQQRLAHEALGRAVIAQHAAETAQADAARERDEARRARDGEAIQRRRAELQEQAARQVTDFTTDVLAMADPRFSHRPNATVRELLDFASQKVGQFDDHPLAEARIRGTIGRAYLWLQEFDAAEPHLTQAIEILRASGADDRELNELHMARQWSATFADVPNPAAADDSIAALFYHLIGVEPAFGDLLQRKREAEHREYGAGYTESRALLEKVMARAEDVLPRGHPDRPILAYVLIRDADVVATLDQDEYSLALAEPGHRIFTEEYGPDDVRTLSVSWRLIHLYTNFERWDAADELLKERIDAAQRVLGDDHPMVRALYVQRAECAAARGHLEAIAELERLVAGFDEQQSRFGLFRLFAIARLARALERAGRAQEADEQRRRLAEIALAHDHRIDQHTLERHAAGRLFWQAAKFAHGPSARKLPRDQVNATFLELLGEIERSVPAELAPDDPRRAILARMLTDLADTMEELPYIERQTVVSAARLALELAEPFEDQAPFIVSRAITEMTWPPDPDNLRRGEQLMRRAVALRRKQAHLDPWWAAHAESLLAEYLLLQGRPAEAERMLASAYATIFRSLGPANGNARGTLERMLKASHDASEGDRQSAGYVGALAQLLFGVALGAESAATDAEMLDLHRRLAAEQHDEAAIRELLAVMKRRISPDHMELGRLAMLVQHWTQEYVAAGGKLDVAYALTDEFLALIRAGPRLHRSAQQRLCWLGATIGIIGDGADGRAEAFAREGLRLTDGAGGLWHALLQSALGECLRRQGRSAEARPLLTSAYESLDVLLGAGNLDTSVALRRLVHVLEDCGDPDAAAAVCAERLRQLAHDSRYGSHLNATAWYIVRRPGRPSELYELALHAAEAATRAIPGAATYQDTLGVAQFRCGTLEDSVATLRLADKLHVGAGGTPQLADWAFLAMAHFQLGQIEEARSSLERAEEIAAAREPLDSEDVSILNEARDLLAAD